CAKYMVVSATEMDDYLRFGVW
nr:immunoglobulin heavy chain junction region [Macaca mulatta]MOV53588.1 immunoglobulin heavy chain junction region [Macaca mulatta]MOV53961.1 immunoglobulin heavy chain junction region [Macaca mulatta]MOV54037.1 immunoglobulin heavy chain junction region [Macaca mulatta]MOV54041.1 immunoglobulin heavy chain junction region [Macaca mulatta]